MSGVINLVDSDEEQQQEHVQEQQVQEQVQEEQRQRGIYVLADLANEESAGDHEPEEDSMVVVCGRSRGTP